MTTLEDILTKLDMVRAELESTYKVDEIGVFGSVVRGEQQDSSDIDILVDLRQDADLLDLIGLAQFLEERLQYKIDVVPRKALRPELREQVLREVRYL